MNNDKAEAPWRLKGRCFMADELMRVYGWVPSSGGKEMSHDEKVSGSEGNKTLSS